MFIAPLHSTLPLHPPLPLFSQPNGTRTPPLPLFSPPPCVAKQAKLLSRSAEDAKGHAYHAECRERAARVIQSYLSRQQQLAAESEAGMGADGTGGEHVPSDGTVYSSEEVEMLRRLQRAFRAHVHSQEEEAEEVLHATRSAASAAAASGVNGGIGGETLEYDRLCQILRRCAQEGGSAADLSREEQAVLSTLQQRVRDHIGRKRVRTQQEGERLPTVHSELAMETMAREAEEEEDVYMH